MNATSFPARLRVRFFLAAGCMILAALAYAADPPKSQSVRLDATKAGPRTMEDLTRSAVARDYSKGWEVLTEAFAAGSPAALDAYFVGTARKDLGASVESQNSLGLQSHYVSQQHDLKVVFYAPEGDVLELQDTAHVELQVSDGKKIIEDHPVILHYVVLMTPAADRWVIRQMQAVQQF